MALPNLPWEGGCRCGSVRLRISAPPIFTAICHCTGCQRMTGSAYSMTVAVPEYGFATIQGATVIGGMHDLRLNHHHCEHCKSWLFTIPEPSMGFVNVRATMLDDASWVRPFVETYTSEAHPWARVGAPHSFPQFPPMEAYQMLLAEFAQAQREAIS